MSRGQWPAGSCCARHMLTCTCAVPLGPASQRQVPRAVQHVAMFSRRVIARCGPPAGVPYNASALFRGKTVWGCGLRTVHSVRYSFELGTIEKGLEQRLVWYCPILYVHVLGYILKPFGGHVGPPWAGS